MMSKKNVDLVFSLLKKTEPQTPNQIAEKAKLNQKTVQTILLELAMTNNKVVKMKKIGRYRLFWRE
jgi:predicted transcriptional regulator